MWITLKQQNYSISGSLSTISTTHWTTECADRWPPHHESGQAINCLNTLPAVCLIVFVGPGCPQHACSPYWCAPDSDRRFVRALELMCHTAGKGVNTITIYAICSNAELCVCAVYSLALGLDRISQTSKAEFMQTATRKHVSAESINTHMIITRNWIA